MSAALSLILSPTEHLATREQIEEFSAFAVDRGVDLGTIRVAESGGKIVWAILPLMSPGKTMLLLSPQRPAHPSAQMAAEALTRSLCGELAEQVHLAQALVDPAEQATRRLYESAGFKEMAELLYLYLKVSQGTQGGDGEELIGAPEGLGWQRYSGAVHDAFGKTILATYERSLDCPALNGLRDIEDILEGHKASGEFDPTLWLMLREGETALAVLLLARAPRAEAMELVYLGLTPAARGRGLSALLMRQAIASTKHHGVPRLSLAVDSRNVPALKLYYRHGMQRLTSKVAYFRDLRGGK